MWITPLIHTWHFLINGSKLTSWVWERCPMTFVRELLSYFSQVMYLLLAFTFGMASVCITAFTISVPLRIAGRKQRMLISPCERGPVPGWCRLYQTEDSRICMVSRCPDFCSGWTSLSGSQKILKVDFVLARMPGEREHTSSISTSGKRSRWAGEFAMQRMPKDLCPRREKERELEVGEQKRIVENR